MKIVSLFGSPRKKGNTAVALNLVEEELKSKGHEVERINVHDMTVYACLECYTCQKKDDEPGCPQKDDALEIFGKMTAADAVIYASPVFCWSWAAQIKPLIDRHFCLVTGAGTNNWKSLLDGKRTGLVMTSGGPVQGNGDLLVQQFDNLMQYAKAQVKAKLLVPLCTTPDKVADTVASDVVQFAAALTA